MPIRNIQLRRARALKIIQTMITNSDMSRAQIGKLFNVSGNTIRNEIDWAQRQGLIADYEDALLNDLVPKALKAFRTALDNGDAQVALEVLKGTGLLRKQTDKSFTNPTPQVAEESLELYVKRTRHIDSPSPPSLPANPQALLNPRSVLQGALVDSETVAQTMEPVGDESGFEDELRRLVESTDGVESPDESPAES